MDVVCEWFVATAEGVRDAFPNWQEPLLSPQRRQLRNPFSGELVFGADGSPFMTESYLPEVEPEAAPQCPNLTGFWSINLWPLGAFEVADLAAAVGVTQPVAARPTLFARSSSGWSLHQLPELVLNALLESPDDVQQVALRWAEASLCRVAPEDVEDDPYNLIGDWQPALRALKDLCTRAKLAAANVYIYQGCCVPTEHE
jgi:hypothetical protein